MNKKNWSNILSVLARAALAFVFVFGQTAWAGHSQSAKDKPGSNGNSKAKANASLGVGPAAKSPAAEEENVTAQASSSQENPSRGGQHEGIKVHGHWTIEVRNPDGAVINHREFENSLQSSGGIALASILAGAASPGMWEIRLNGSASTPSPCPPAPSGFRFRQRVILLASSCPAFSPLLPLLHLRTSFRILRSIVPERANWC